MLQSCSNTASTSDEYTESIVSLPQFSSGTLANLFFLPRHRVWSTTLPFFLASGGKRNQIVPRVWGELFV